MHLYFISVRFSISFCFSMGKELRVAGLVIGYLLDISWQGQNSSLPLSLCGPGCTGPLFFNRLCTFHVVCENWTDTEAGRWVIIQCFMFVTSLLSSMPFISQTCLTPSAKLVVISLAALHIPLIFYCNRSYLCAGLTWAPACQPALLVVQNVVYMKQLTRNPKGLLQVQCRKPKPPQIPLITKRQSNHDNIKSCIRAALLLLLLFCVFLSGTQVRLHISTSIVCDACSPMVELSEIKDVSIFCTGSDYNSVFMAYEHTAF